MSNVAVQQPHTINITMRSCSGSGHKLSYSPEYLERCRKYPRFRHTLGEHPAPPVPLLSCPFCGGEAQTQFTMFGYGEPSYTIKCLKCAARCLPQSWGVGLLILGEGWHTVTEPEALERACRKWNARHS